MSQDTLDSRVEKRAKDELETIDMNARYRDMIDECYSFASVGGPFEHMTPSRVLEEVDPVAFRCGFNDWTDGETRDRGLVEIDGDFYDEDEIDEIRDEIEAEDAAAEEAKEAAEAAKDDEKPAEGV